MNVERWAGKRIFEENFERENRCYVRVLRDRWCHERVEKKYWFPREFLVKIIIMRGNTIFLKT